MNSEATNLVLRAQMFFSPLRLYSALILCGDSQRLCNPSLAKFQKCSRPRRNKWNGCKSGGYEFMETMEKKNNGSALTFMRPLSSFLCMI